jgi:hypothetical protein
MVGWQPDRHENRLASELAALTHDACDNPILSGRDGRDSALAIGHVGGPAIPNYDTITRREIAGGEGDRRTKAARK